MGWGGTGGRGCGVDGPDGSSRQTDVAGQEPLLVDLHVERPRAGGRLQGGDPNNCAQSKK